MKTDQNKTRPTSPGELLRSFLNEHGWTQDDLALITGRSVTAINNVVTGRSSVTPEMASCFAAAFGNQAEDWLQAEASYRLFLLSTDTTEIAERAKLFAAAPVREMQKRGWIQQVDDVQQIASELTQFWGSDGGVFPIALRRSAPIATRLTPAESAWCIRARYLASTLIAAPFSEKRAPKLRNELKKLAAHPKEARDLSKVLADFGIRLVVVEPLTTVRIDGAAFWDESGPIIALSIRHDRIDGFWFTLMHECSHIIHGDSISVDREMIDAVQGVTAGGGDDEAERRANQDGASWLIPAAELDSFINRVGPLYSKDRVIQFANRIRIHPGIIVGQLQHRGEIGYSSLREQLAKIRNIVTSTTLTDGWGQIISPPTAPRERTQS